MSVLRLDLDAREIAALSLAVEEYRQHTSVRGELIDHIIIDAAQRKLEAAVEECLVQERVQHLRKEVRMT